MKYHLPFYRAIVHSNKKARAESFARLVELGGGKVVKAEPPYTDAKGATHCMYEKVPNVGVDFKVNFQFRPSKPHSFLPRCLFRFCTSIVT